MSFVYRENKEELNNQLYRAAGGCDVEKCRRFIEKGADVDASNGNILGWTPAHAAARNGNYEVIRLLAEAGATLNQEDEDGKTAAMFAASDGHSETVRVLAEASVDLHLKDKYDRTVLYYACRWGDNEIVKYLLSQGLDPSSPKCLTTAIILYHHDVVVTLITAGGNVNKVRIIKG